MFSSLFRNLLTKENMQLADVNSILRIYDDKKGLRRKIFGDHPFIKELRKKYLKQKCFGLRSYFLPDAKGESFFKFMDNYDFKENDKGAGFECYKKIKMMYAAYWYDDAIKNKIQIKAGYQNQYDEVIRICHILVGTHAHVMACPTVTAAKKKLENRGGFQQAKRTPTVQKQWVSNYVAPILTNEEIYQRQQIALLKSINSEMQFARTGYYIDPRYT